MSFVVLRQVFRKSFQRKKHVPLGFWSEINSSLVSTSQQYYFEDNTCLPRSRYRPFTTSQHFKMPFAKIEGKELHYTDNQPSSGTVPLTIVFVHGLGSTQNYYQTVLPYLSSYRCITFDNYGAGRSKYFPDMIPETSVEAIGRDVVGLLDYLKVEKAVVVGYSMGGMIPTHLASNQKTSSRVVAGICIGPVNPSPAVAEVFKKRVPTVEQGEPSCVHLALRLLRTSPKSSLKTKAPGTY
jgi:pimeloyl-ACP methyl ester carboxylesterase